MCVGFDLYFEYGCFEQLVYPGAWLSDMSLERYEVREKKTSKKVLLHFCFGRFYFLFPFFRTLEMVGIGRKIWWRVGVRWELACKIRTRGKYFFCDFFFPFPWRLKKEKSVFFGVWRRHGLEGRKRMKRLRKKWIRRGVDLDSADLTFYNKTGIGILSFPFLISCFLYFISFLFVSSLLSCFGG